MNEAMFEQLIMQAVESKDGKNALSCEKAHEMSRNHSISLKQIGDFCHERHIKIKNCELGCF